MAEAGKGRKKKAPEESTIPCETPGCGNGHYQLGVCHACFDR